MPTPPATTAPVEQTARLRTVVARLARWAARTTAGEDLTATQTMVLATVVRQGPLGATEIARREGLNPTMLSRILRRLEEAGLVERTADPDDGRAILIRTTRAGQRRHEAIRRARGAELGAALDALDPGERTTLFAALPVLERLAAELRDRR